jgi:hypothetical protein
LINRKSEASAAATREELHVVQNWVEELKAKLK